MTSRSGFAFLGSLLALALATACNPPPTDGADTDNMQQSITPTPRPSGDADPVGYTRGGVTVHLPNGCSPEHITPGTCRGLQSLRLAKRGPLDDLMRPGVYEREGSWVGLRLVEGSFVFAEASSEEVVTDLLASATPSDS